MEAVEQVILYHHSGLWYPRAEQHCFGLLVLISRTFGVKGTLILCPDTDIYVLLKFGIICLMIYFLRPILLYLVGV